MDGINSNLDHNALCYVHYRFCPLNHSWELEGKPLTARLWVSKQILVLDFQRKSYLFHYLSVTILTLNDLSVNAVSSVNTRCSIIEFVSQVTALMKMNM